MEISHLKSILFGKLIGVLNPTLVRSCCPESKRMSDNLCVVCYHQYGVDAKIVRLSHVYGLDWNFGSGRVCVGVSFQ